MSSLREPPLASGLDTVGLVTGLVPGSQREEAARELARHLGAENLLIFVLDPEVRVLLPAPGFPQTLPESAAWRRFLTECDVSTTATATLCDPRDLVRRRTVGFRGAEGSVLALLGGTPDPARTSVVLTLLPLLAAAFSGERAAKSAAANAHVARQMAEEAAFLASSLERARLHLQEALMETEAALHLREEFLSIASHELKTPLTSLQLQVQILRRALANAPGPMTERLQAMAEKVEVQVRRLTRLSTELLDASRLGAGKLDLEPGPVELGALTREVVERFALEAQKRNTRLELQVEHEITGYWDPLRIDQILTNLISNAIKYGQGNPVELRVSADERWARTVVTDHGVGIPAHEQQRIFDRFERVHRQGDPGGLGMGLYIVRQLVELHGGRILVQSDGEHGTSFTVELPR